MTKNAVLPYPCILLIDCTDKDRTAVALLRDSNEPLLVCEDLRAQELPRMIDGLLASVGVLPAELKAIALSKRSGSMTAIRIGTATANTLAWLRRLPIIELESQTIEQAIELLERGDTGRVVRTSQPFA